MEALRDLVLFGVCLFLVRESSWIVHLVEQGTIHETTRMNEIRRSKGKT